MIKIMVEIDADVDKCGKCKQQKDDYENVGWAVKCRQFHYEDVSSGDRCDACIKAQSVAKEAIDALVLQYIRRGNFTVIEKDDDINE